MTKVVCDWISARGQYLKKKMMVGKSWTGKKIPTGCQSFGPFVWVVFQTMTLMIRLRIVLVKIQLE